MLLSESLCYIQSWDFYAFLMMPSYRTGAPRVSSHFQQEFPSLQAAGEAEKGDEQEEEPYGPGPSLRPQSKATLVHVNVHWALPDVREPQAL